MKIVKRIFFLPTKHTMYGLLGCDIINGRQVYPYDNKEAAEAAVKVQRIKRSQYGYLQDFPGYHQLKEQVI